MNIAVCDDEIVYLEEIVKIINNIKAHYSDIEIVVYTFESGENLIQSIISNENVYDIILLDIHMNELSGIEVTKIIKQRNSNVKIIFISGIVGSVTNAIRAGGDGFVLKDNIYKDLEEELKITIEKIINYGNLYYSVIYNSEKFDVKIKDIVYIEVIMKKLDIHMCSGKIFRVTGKMKEAKEKLEDNGFISPHNSFIVNCKFIKEFRTKDILLLSDEKIIIAQGKHKKTYNEYLKYELGWK